jgi:UDP-N-acetylglucosamine--N-acetylmuramyl-(pentapeptide) pyrophosphoryl-undecaprenol N-acetylglucosamine transferase
VYPALAVLQALQANVDSAVVHGELMVLWIGGEGGMEADLVKRAGVPFETIPAAGVHGVGVRALPGNLWRLGRGYTQAIRLLRRFQPQVLFFTGGYVAAPVAAAARRLRGFFSNRRAYPKSLLYVPDIEPGLALKSLARLADHIALTSEDSQIFFPHHRKMTVTGYPARPELKAWDRERGLKSLNLSADLPVLLVFGGSRGARSINRALLPALPKLLSEMQIVHISGSLDWQEVAAKRDELGETLAESRSTRYHPFPYLHERMGAALACADLAVSRAGASTLGEFPLFGLPAVLVPYPHAWRYQWINAQYLAQRGGAVVVKDERLSEELLPTVRSLIHNPQRLADMSIAMRSLSHPEAANRLGSLLGALASTGGGAA